MNILKADHLEEEENKCRYHMQDSDNNEFVIEFAQKRSNKTEQVIKDFIFAYGLLGEFLNEAGWPL